MHRSLQARWHRPVRIAVTLIAIAALAFVVYAGAQTYIRYSNPRADVAASYFEKVTNCSSAKVGDVVEVKVLVVWHGYIFPEFKRQVQIIDPYPESNFQLVGGNNTYQYSGYGGGNQFMYLLKVISEGSESVELPRSRLYLDNSEIHLSGANVVIELQTNSEKES
jgi:hypothetical protein